jgi:hypothetical protein
MNNKEKQIVEELANDIYGLKSCDTSFEENCKLLAYDLITLGWIKPSENSVVLSREEMERLKNLSNLIPKLSLENLKLKEEQKEMQRAIAKDNSVNWLLKQDRRITEKRVSKETAEKIINPLLDIEVIDEDYKQFFLDVCGKLEELADEHSVEIKE